MVAARRTDLRSARKRKRWTQADLAERSHVDTATISRIEAGLIRNPHHDTVTAMEQALGLRRGTLQFGVESEGT